MNYEFDYFDHYVRDEMMEVFAVVGAVLVAVFAVVSIFSLVMYILRSLALHTIAKRRGLNNAWLSWIPVGQEWIIGSVSDQYKYVTQGKVQNRRTLLLLLQLAAMIVGTVHNGISLGGLVMEGMYEFGYSGFPAGSFLPGFLLLPLSLLSSGVGIAAFVFRQMSMYDLYKSCNTKNCVVFLVLGIIFPVTEPFFLMSCRYREDGMPPRKAGPSDPDPVENWTQDPEPFVDVDYETPTE